MSSDKELPTSTASLPQSASPLQAVGSSYPWAAQYEPGVPITLDPSDAVFPDVLARAAGGAPTLPALSFHLRSQNYATTLARVEQVARAMVRDGVRPGDAVRIALDDSPEWVEAALGAQRAGAIVDVDGTCGVAAVMVTSLARLAEPAVADAASAARRLVVADPARSLPLQQRLVVALARRRRPRPDPPSKGGLSWALWLAGKERGELRLPELAPDDPAYAAGGHVFAHKHLVAGAAQLRSWLVDALPDEESWLLLAPLETPLGFVAGLGAAFALRARVILLPGGRSADAMDAVRYLRPTWVLSSGDAVERIAADPRLAKADLRSVRGWLVGDPLGTGVVQAFEESAGLPLCMGWSPAGAAGFVALPPINGARSAGTLGLPMPGVVVRRAAGRLVMHGPNILPSMANGMLGQIDQDGWIRFG